MLSPSWQSDGPDGWPTSHIVWALVLGRKRLDFIVELFSSRAAARETLAGISGSLWICVKCVIEFLQLKCVVWNFQSSLSSDRGSSRVEGIIRVWIAIIVSQINFIFVQALFQLLNY